jgi:hypothetical protein
MQDADLSRWTAQLRRALISVQPAYFGWSPDEQLRYRVTLPDADREAVVAALLRAHGRRRPVATAGPDDGKVEGGLIRWDQRVDADGHEALLEELQHRVWGYEARRCQDLLVEFEDHGRAATWFIDDPYPDTAKAEDESNLLIVFSDPAALARARFTTFLRDCRAMQQPRHELNTLEDREVRAILNFAREQHDDLRRNFDPKVTPLRKRRKVMLHPHALRDLEDDGAC